MNPFAGSKSGMANMLESFLPPDVLEAIKLAKEQLPNVIAQVQQAVTRIETRLETIDTRTAIIMQKLNLLVTVLDPNAVPDELPSQLLEALHNSEVLPNGEVKMLGTVEVKSE